MAAASARRSRGVRPDGVAKSCAFALHHHVTTDQLVDALWPDVLPANPSAAVRVIITPLRASLGDHGDALVRTGSSYELHANYDIDRFSKGIEQEFAAYDRGDRAGAHQHLTVSYALCGVIRSPISRWNPHSRERD